MLLLSRKNKRNRTKTPIRTTFPMNSTSLAKNENHEFIICHFKVLLMKFVTLHKLIYITNCASVSLFVKLDNQICLFQVGHSKIKCANIFKSVE